MRVQKVLFCPFLCKPRPSRVSCESRRLENISPVAGNRAELGQNHYAREAVSGSPSVLTWSGGIFRLKSSKENVEKVLLCLFHCKPRPSVVRLKSLGLENIPQLPGNRTAVGENHDACKAV